MADAKAPVSIFGTVTTPDAAGPYTIPLSVNGAPPAATIAVPTGTNLVISDISMLGGITFGNFFLQQANDGVTFFAIGLFNTIGSGFTTQSQLNSPRVGWVVFGGPSVIVRVQVSNPADAGGAGASVTLRAYTEA